jgi:enoyl-CoA hydratase/carnithine racemase
MAETNVIKYDIEDGIAHITLNRPEKRNAITYELTRALNQTLRSAKEDEGVRAVVITGAGSAFCAGLDLSVVQTLNPVALKEFMATFYGEMTDLHRGLGKPTIAALNGHTLAAGCTIAFSCDLIVASEEVRIGYPEINVGLMPSLHLVLLPHLVGRYKAFELCLTGEPITAHDALKWGMINRVVAPAELPTAARQLARTLAAKSPLLVKYCKDTLYQSMDVEFKKAIMIAADMLCLARSSEDTDEGLRAFLEKRLPVWKGR